LIGGARFAVAALAALTLTAPLAGALDCPYPLGNHLLTGDAFIVNGSLDDPESALFELEGVGSQFTAGQIAYDSTFPATLHFAYETEADFVPRNSTLKSEVHTIAYKSFSQLTGWNTRPIFLSSNDLDNPVPVADSTHPSLIAYGGGTWVAWHVGGHVIDAAGLGNQTPPWPSSGAYIVMRGNTNGTWGPIQPLSPISPIASNLRVSAAAYQDGAYYAYQTNALDPNRDSFHIVGRSYNGRAFAPVEDITAAGDGWSDETVDLASNGSSVAAVWVSRNDTDFASGATQVWLRIRTASGAWANPALVSPGNETDVRGATVAWHDGRWLVAWAANDPAVSSGGDSSILMRSVDAASGLLSAVVPITDGNYPGDEGEPALQSYGGSLYIAWNSNSLPDGSGGLAADLDTHMRILTSSALGPIILATEPPNEPYSDLWPGFLVAGDALFLTYGSNMNDGSYAEHNQRQLTRLLVRPARWYDNLNATYGLRTVPGVGTGPVVVNLQFTVNGTPIASPDHLAVELSNGYVIRLPANFSSGDIRIPTAPGRFDAPSAAYWCGLPIPLTEAPPLYAAFPRPISWLSWMLIGAVGLVAVLLFARLVGRRRSADQGKPRRGTAEPEDRAAREPEGDLDDE